MLLRVPRFTWLILAVTTIGCGAANEHAPVSAAKESATFSAPPAAPASGLAVDQAADGDAVPPAEAATLKRKIIYNAEIGLVVEDFSAVEPKISELVKAAGGYIAELQVLGSPGSRRSARWRLRVPVDVFERFLVDVAGLGELESNHRDSEDVSEQFYDLEARMKNKRTEEERLVQILRENTGKIEDVLKVEAELSRVRGEIERMQGRLRVLEDLSSMTTVTVSVRERDRFQPPPPTAADFPTIVGRTFRNSVNQLQNFGKAVVLLVVALVPWIPLILIGLFILWRIKGRIGGRFRRARPIPTPP